MIGLVDIHIYIYVLLVTDIFRKDNHRPPKIRMPRVFIHLN